MTMETYLARLGDAMPGMLPERARIIADVRAHIAEAIGHGEALDAVLARLGDPAALAQSYLSEVPLVSASPGRRAAAMAIDIAIPVALAALAELFVRSGAVSRYAMLIVLGFIITAGFITYILVGESRLGQTLGKHWLKLLVVRESGARIGVGQAIVRLLPSLLHVWFIDVVFALFTEKQQRAFELLSKTRVVTIDPRHGTGG